MSGILTAVILASVGLLTVAFIALRREVATARELARVRGRFATILDAAGEGIYGLDLDGHATFVNPAAARMLGYEPHELVGRAMRDTVLGDDVYRKKDGGWLAVESVSTTIYEGGAVAGAVIVFRDVSERRAQVAALEHQATHDALTGLPNRALLYDRLEVATAAARRSGAAMALLLIDLDRFKEINDTLGHQNGDLVLQQVGPRVRRALRASDTIARLGGDEFAVLLPDVGDAENAVALARAILRSIEEPLLLEGEILTIGASIGIAVAPEHGDNADLLLRRADIAMYVAKRSGCGHAVYATTQDLNGRRRLQLAAQLRGGIDAGQLFLVYQPKLDLRSARIAGVEALVRWRHPLLGLLPPSQFIPIAEQTGLIGRLTLWALREALAAGAAWRREGIELPVSVNLSARTLQDTRFPAEVAKLIAESGARPDTLALDVPESALMADPARASGVLGELSRLGVRLAIDDFGTGFSSLAHLGNLPVRELKIDRSLAGADGVDPSVARSAIELGHNLGFDVLAEGIEDEPALERVVRLGCDFAQGFWIGRPTPAGEVTRFLREPQDAVRRVLALARGGTAPGPERGRRTGSGRVRA